MGRPRSTVVTRRLLPALLAATLLPAAAFAALVVAMPGASATSQAAAAMDTWLPSSSILPPVSPTASSTTPSLPPISPFPPGPPSNLTATAVTTGSVTLSWTASTRGCCQIVGYDITYYQAFNDIVWTQQVVGNVTTATVTASITRTKQYTFSVLARDDMGRRSATSNTVTVVTPNTDTGDTIPPSAPGGLTAASTPTGSTAQLNWTASTDNVGVTGYDVYSFDGLFNSRLLATVAGTVHTVPLSVGRNVFYVRARDAAGNLSAASNSVNVAGLPNTSTSPPVTPGLCTVTYTNQSQWSGGFVASVTIRNASTSAAINGWTLTFTFPGDQRITSAWSARVTQTGALVTAQHHDWNGTIPVGGSVTFGMQGTWTSSNAAPAAFSLNGTGCV